MKRTSNILTATILAFMLFVANIVGMLAPSAQTASADSGDDYNGEIMYYMYDFYPSLTEGDLSDPTGDEVYYRYVAPQELNWRLWDLLDLENTLIFLDVKSTAIDRSAFIEILELLYYKNCPVVLLTSYSQDYFDGLEDYLAFAVYDLSFERVQNFMAKVIDSVYGNFVEDGLIEWNASFILHNIALLTDPITTIPQLCQFSKLFKAFHDELYNTMDFDVNLNNVSTASYDMEGYCEALKINVFLEHDNITPNEELNYTYSSIDELYDYPHYSQYVFAICISPISDDMYDMLYQAQLNNQEITVFLFEAAPVNFSDEGLEVVSSGSLLGGEESDPDALDVVGMVEDLLGDIYAHS